MIKSIYDFVNPYVIIIVGGYLYVRKKITTFLHFCDSSEMHQLGGGYDAR